MIDDMPLGLSWFAEYCAKEWEKQDEDRDKEGSNDGGTESVRPCGIEKNESDCKGGPRSD